MIASLIGIKMKITVSFLDTLEEQIRTNSAPKLEHFLKSHTYEIPRPLTARYVNLIRRMGGPKYALAILNPIVRNELSKPTTEEIIEYATCLCRVGLIDEGVGLLNSIANEPYAEIQFELALACMSKWDYSKAIPYLIKYLSFKELSSYKVCVGEINLAAAYIYTNEIKKAENLLRKLIVKMQKNNFSLLWGNALELQGEIAFANRHYDQANKLFEEAAEKLQFANPRYRLYQEKWKVILRMIRENGSKDSLLECHQLRKKVAEIHDWNSLREIELYKAIVTKNLEAITYLYYGSPYLEYRRRILAAWGKSLNIENEHYDRKIGPGVAQEKNVFDIAAGRDLFTGAKLKVGQNMYRLLQVLTSDFYAPFLTTKLFSLVFKNVFFNPATSPKQVHQLVKRLSDWFVDNKIPLAIKYGNAGYRLRAEKGYVLRIPTNVTVRSKIDDFMELLKRNGLVKNFQVKEVIEKLHLSRRSTFRLLSEAVARGKLERKGRSQNTVYRVIESSVEKSFLTKP